MMRFERYDRVVEYYPTMWPLLIPGYIPILNAMQEIARSLPEPPRHLMDLGCGPGAATIAVAAASHPEGKVTLVDGSQAMLDMAQQVLGSHVRAAYCGDYRHPAVDQAFTPNFYDLIMASFALHHLPDDAKRHLITRLGASLRPGGVLLLADEVAVDRPGGWGVTEQIRGRIVQEHLAAGRITQQFWEIETSLPQELHLPFLPARIEDLTSWMAHSGLAVATPVALFGSALLIGVKTTS